MNIGWSRPAVVIREGVCRARGHQFYDWWGVLKDDTDYETLDRYIQYCRRCLTKEEKPA